MENIINSKTPIHYNDQEHIIDAENYIKQILNTQIVLSPKQVRWLVRYILNKEVNEYGLKTEIKTTTFVENISQSLKNKENKKFILVLDDIYKTLITKAFNDEKVGNGLITFNTDFYYLDMLEGNHPLFRIPFDCYHEIKHAIQHEEKSDVIINNKPISLNDYILFREKYIFFQAKEGNNFYYKNHNKFLMEVEADIFAADKTTLFFERYAPNITSRIKSPLMRRRNIASNTQNMYDINLFNDGLDTAVKKDMKKDPLYLSLEENKMLLLEFNNDGSRKSLLDTIRINKEEFNITDEVLYSLICNSLTEMDEVGFNSYLSKMNNDDINRLHKALTYKSDILLQRRNRNTRFLNDKVINNGVWLSNDCKITNEYVRMLNFENLIDNYTRNNIQTLEITLEDDLPKKR